MQEKAKPKRKKFQLVFNEDERREYLTGFRKRNEERKKKAIKRFEERKKEEKRKLREERKNILKEIYLSQRTVPEVEHLVEPVIYELPDHIVTVASIDSLDFIGQDGTRLGQNNFVQDNEDSNDESEKPEEVKANVCIKKLLKNRKEEKKKLKQQFRNHQKQFKKKHKQKKKHNKTNRESKHLGKRKKTVKKS